MFELTHRHLLVGTVISITSSYCHSLKSAVTSISSTGNSFVHLSSVANWSDVVTIRSQALPCLEVPAAGLTTTTSIPSGDNTNYLLLTPDTAKQGSVMMIKSLALPHHGISCTTTSSHTTTSPLILPFASPTQASAVSNGVPLPCHRPNPPCSPTPMSTANSCNHECWSNDCLIVHTRFQEVSGRKEEIGEMRIEQDRREEDIDLGVEEMRMQDSRREGSTRVRDTCKPPTPPPTYNNKHKQGHSKCYRQQQRQCRCCYRCCHPHHGHMGWCITTQPHSQSK